MADERCCASSPCFADEVDDVYAGYLPPGELAAAIEHLIALADAMGPDTRAKWQQVLGSGAGAGPTPHADGETLESAARALLPRIRDDRLHGRLARLLDAL